MSETEQGKAETTTAEQTQTQTETNPQPSEATVTRWRLFLEQVDVAAKRAELVGLVVSGALGEKLDEDKTRLTALSAAMLPSVNDAGAIRELSVMLVRASATACANEAGRLAAVGVAGAVDAAIGGPAAAPAPAATEAPAAPAEATP